MKSTPLIWVIGFWFFTNITSSAQNQARTELSLQECYTLLQDRYPLLKQSDIYASIFETEKQIIEKSRLPSINLKAEGRVQSESTNLDAGEGVMLPFEIDLPLYSYKSYAEGQYVLMDGGLRKAQTKAKEMEYQSNLSKLDVEGFVLRQRIDAIVVNVLLIREQLNLLDISIKDLDIRKESIAAAVEYGTALESELTKIEVRRLEIINQQENINENLRGLIRSLEYWLGIEISDNVRFSFPQLGEISNIPSLTRPENSFYQAQREQVLANNDLVDAARAPKLSAFAQLGFGSPNPVNLLDKDLAPYALAGLQFSWQVTDWNKSNLNKQLLLLHALELDKAEATFEFNMESQKAAYLSEVSRLQKLIENTKTIARLHAEVLSQMAVQVDEGVITTTDYLIQHNSELATRQNLLLYETQLFKTQLEFWSQRGAF
jgi:outer membrane protein TolC